MMRSDRLPLIALVLVFTGCVDKLQDSSPDTDTDEIVDLEHTTFEGIELVRIPAGSFTMGAPEGEVGYLGGTETQHEVTLTRDYWIGVTELTQGQFEDVMGYNPSTNTACGADCPVETVSWYESAAFGNALSDLAGLDRCYDCTGEGATLRCTLLGNPYECEGYRLPTEAEWEMAARAGTTAAFSNGGDIPEFHEEDCDGELRLNWGIILDDYAIYCGNDSGSSEPVASKLPNPWGLFDVHGNVGERCGDWFDLYPDGSVDDPTGPDTGKYRIVRGGDWASPPRYLRSAERGGGLPHLGGDTAGLRISRTATE
jgi:formylglycine-generating enzyme required for sulfatase activity